MSRLGIVGPGRMGVGIATVLLLAGRKVTLVDTKTREPGRESESLERAREQVAANLSFMAENGMAGSVPESLLDALDIAGGVEALKGCDLVFEALPERPEIKAAFYGAAGQVLSPQAVIASATSTFAPSFFTGVYRYPQRVVTAHWLNPAFLIPLVEVSAGENCDPEALSMVEELLTSLGKVPVRVKPSPGFIVPRIQAAAMNEAVRMLEEGVATAAELDTAIKAGFGFRLAVVGLVEFIDLGGVDILAHADEYLFSELGQPQFAAPALLKEKMARGEVGPRAGKGFFDYEGVDVEEVFRRRYQGFVELLRLYENSQALQFQGGIERGCPRAQVMHRSS